MSRNHVRFDRRRWALVRRAVFERDGWRCCECGRPGRLECDHVVSLQRDPGQDVFALAGLQSLCRGCHIAKTRSENKRAAPGKSAAAWRALVAEML